jgi:hypothetical protein
MSEEELLRQRPLNELDDPLKEEALLEQHARAGGAAHARLIGVERRIAAAHAFLRSCENGQNDIMQISPLSHCL